MDGRDEWENVSAEDMAEEVYRRRKIVEDKNIICNIIRDYGKIRETAANIINSLDIKNEEAHKVLYYDITGLVVKNSNTIVEITWMETIDEGSIGEETNEYIEEVPAEWFALDDGELGFAIQSYKRSNKERIDSLEETLKKELKALEDMEQGVKNRREAIVGLKNDIAKLKRGYY